MVNTSSGLYEQVPTTDLQEISEDECLLLLGQHKLGRIALMVDDQPLIFPVNYDLHNRIITFRSAKGTKFFCAPGSRVAFEIDGYDQSTGVGWSVLVKGLAVDSTTALDDVSWIARAAAPEPLAPGVKVHWLAISPTQISGRRFVQTVAESGS
jgi:uncharacterized protein